MYSSQSIKEKVGQLFIISVPNDELDQSLKLAISNYHIGGVILFQRNLRDFSKVITLIQDIQLYAKEIGRPPLWISIDQEGGGISYLWDGMAVSPGNMLLGATNKPQNAYDAHYQMGYQLRKIGFNLDFSPVLDINNNPKNPVIGSRSFGETKDLVTEMGIEAIKGLHDAGIMACGKHYPGHGDTELDSHLSLPTINKTVTELEEFELVPFQEAMKHGLEAIMTAHIIYPLVDPDKPATLSRKFLTGILRKQYGYDGLIITDSMEMEAISYFYGKEQGTVMALEAGADMILSCGETYESQFLMMDAVVTAVEKGELKTETINNAYKRILHYKRKWVNPDYTSTKEEIIAHCNNPPTHDLMVKIACEGITVVQDDRKLLPISSDTCTVIYQRTLNDENYMGDRKNPCPTIFTEGNYQLRELNNVEPCTEESHTIYHSLKKDEQVLIFVNERRDVKEEWKKLIDLLYGKTKNIIVISLWNPQIINDIAYKDLTYIACFSNTSHVIQGVKKVIEGKVPPKGKAPVTIVNKESQKR
ncbi:beta-N-acetylhexosaminidase [Evansella sp. AB-rgal1]|uniref:beta-N-acetylhexosaminidase n=1 Tax=Evansella sp. AB-rgal1 TaxID=3242696 RepID=UPI00359E4C88